MAINDIEFVIDLAGHLENPCSDPVRGHDLREDYLIFARQALEILENPWAKDFLQGQIKKYSGDFSKDDFQNF